MKQVKEFSSAKKENKWLKENQDKEIIDIKFGSVPYTVTWINNHWT